MKTFEKTVNFFTFADVLGAEKLSPWGEGDAERAG